MSKDKEIHGLPKLTDEMIIQNQQREIGILKSEIDELRYSTSSKAYSRLENKKETFKGKNNHQFRLKGLKNKSYKGLLTYKKNHSSLDIYIYVGEDYPKSNKSGRVLFHRFLVQENHTLFDQSFFEEINGKFILKEGLDVHHIDDNHNNNKLDNLEILSRSNHTKLHNKNKKIIRDNKTGKIKKICKV
jgi:hypothetical protein